MSESNGNHNPTQSYIIGFILSLLFTGNAYYLVVSKAVTGNALLATIMGLAVAQMAIQIFFFLHLGRGPKPMYNVVFFVGTVGLILVVVLGSMFIMDNLQYNMSAGEVTKKLAQDEAIYQVGGETTGACQGVYTNHRVTIKGGEVSPSQTQAQLCDTLTFINEDQAALDISFGPHPKQEDYAGQEVTVRNGRPKTITLNQAGTYQFHDHLDPAVAGGFTVAPE